MLSQTSPVSYGSSGGGALNRPIRETASAQVSPEGILTRAQQQVSVTHSELHDLLAGVRQFADDLVGHVPECDAKECASPCPDGRAYQLNFALDGLRLLVGQLRAEFGRLQVI